MNLLSLLKNNLLTIILIGLILFQWNDNARRVSSLENVVNQKDEIIDEKINDLGQKVITATVKEYRQGQLDILMEVDSRFTDLDNRLKSNGRKIKDLESSVKFDVSAEGEGVAEQVATSPLPQWKYSDGVLSITSQMNPGDQLFHKWKIYPKSFYVDLFVKDRLFRKPKYQVDISSDSPNIDFSNTNVFTKKAPKPFLTFGVGIGATLLPDFSIKPGLQVSIIKPIYTIYK